MSYCGNIAAPQPSQVKYLILLMSNLIWEITDAAPGGGNEIPSGL
jgi:hypothetical protein